MPPGSSMAGAPGPVGAGEGRETGVLPVPSPPLPDDGTARASATSGERSRGFSGDTGLLADIVGHVSSNPKSFAGRPSSLATPAVFALRFAPIISTGMERNANDTPCTSQQRRTS